MWEKKGQSAGSAATLIAVIVGLIVLYIMFLPPEDRAELLGENVTHKGEIKGIAEDSRLLLKEYPGTITKNKQDEFEHRINSFNLFERSEDKILKQFDNVNVETKRGSIKKKTFALSIDPDKTSNVQLSFQVRDPTGRLIIKLNDEEIYSGEPTGQVYLKLDRLEQDNVIEFSSEDVGWQFWKTNSYDLIDVKVTGTLRVLQNLEASQTFIVGGDEAQNIESASIRYIVDCKQTNVGMLKLYINEEIISSGVPDCGSAAKFELNPNIINKGTNKILFKADSGAYLLDQVLIKTRLKQPIEPIYYFEVNSTKYTWVINNTFRAKLNMKFVDDGLDKRAQLNINNRLSGMDADREANFTEDISPFLIEGNNFLKITPQTNLNIVELSIRLE